MFGLDKYNYFINTSGFDYEFESIGNKGIIKKVASFTEIAKPSIYNFGFGDLDENKGEIIDNISSNNGDHEKILVTLGYIILDFITQNPTAQILIKGTDERRTRLYQINISKYWGYIQQNFEVYGLFGDKWQPFQKGKNYKAFLGRKL